MTDVNDPELTAHVVTIERLARQIDYVARELGASALAELLADLQRESREAEWRCNDILREKANGA